MDRPKLEQMATLFHEAKVHTIIVTLGAQGVFYSRDSSESGLVPGIKVNKVVDTTAAGDTFVGYFATALARWTGGSSGVIAHDPTKEMSPFPVEEAIKAANAAAAKCVQRTGAMQSIPWGYE